MPLLHMDHAGGIFSNMVAIHNCGVMIGKWILGEFVSVKPIL